MSANLYVTRAVVESWPTDDGHPWPRFISFDEICEADTDVWFRRLYDNDALEEFTAGDNEYTGDPIGYILPAPGRRHWFSRAAALRWAERCRQLGAVVTVTSSKAVVFPGADQ